MLRFAICKTFGATLFFGTIFVMGFKLWEKKWGGKNKLLTDTVPCIKLK